MEPDERRAEEYSLAERQKFLGNEFDLYLPTLGTGPKVPHYYGDSVRSFFMVIAIIMLVLAPFFGSYLPWALPFEIISALALVVLAGLTNPKSQFVMMINAAVAALGLLVFEIVALNAYVEGSMLLFLAREVIAVCFLIALYQSLRTLRHMMLGTIGRATPTGQFFQESVMTKEEKLKDIREHTDSGD